MGGEIRRVKEVTYVPDCRMGWLNMKLIPAMLVMVFLLYACSNGVSLDAQKWVYEKGECNVTFTLRNHGKDESNQKVRIMAHEIKEIGKGAMVKDVTGAKIISVTLKPSETKEMAEILTIFSNRQPDIVAVTLQEEK